MIILITGAAGFIASNVAKYLKIKYPNYILIILDKLDVCSNLKNIPQNTIFLKGDICNADLVNHILNEYKIEYIMHFAAETHVDNSFGNSLKFTQSNVLGTHTLLECSKNYGKLKKFIHVSTDEVYGEASHHSNNASVETDKFEPTNPYAATKAAAEHLVNAYRISFKLPTMITRSNNIFGIQQFPEKLIPKFITLLSQGKKCQIHGTGTNKRSYLHVDDVSAAFDLILHQGVIGGVYNIGSVLEFENIQVFRYIIEIFRRKYPEILMQKDDDSYLEFVADRNFNDLRYLLNYSQIEELGWKQEKLDFESELEKVVDWYLANSNYWLSLETALDAHQVKK